MNQKDEIYKRRKKCWLSYGRALIVLGILGLLTVSLYIVTQSSFSGKSISDENLNGSQGDEKIDEIKRLDESVHNQLATHKRIKRNVRSLDNSSNTSINVDNSDENLLSLNDLEEKDLKLDNHHLKQLSRQPDSSQPHRHPDGDLYYYKGYKCIPIRRASKISERISGMLYEYLSSCSRRQMSCFFFPLNHDEHNNQNIRNRSCFRCTS